MKFKTVSKLVILTLAVSALAMTACNKKPDAKAAATVEDKKLSAEDILAKIDESNTRDNISSLYKSYEEIYSSSDDTEKSYTYVSHDIWFNHYGEDEMGEFAFMDEKLCVGYNEENVSPFYSCVIDEVDYLSYFDTYMEPYKYDFTDYTKTLREDGSLELDGDLENFVFEYDKDTFLKTKETYTLKEYDDYFVSSEYKYLDTERDAEIRKNIEKYVQDYSGGKTIKLTVVDLEGKEHVFDFPYGFQALIYAGTDTYEYALSPGEYYSGEEITDDMKLIAVEEEFDEEYGDIDSDSLILGDDYVIDGEGIEEGQYYIDEDGNIVIDGDDLEFDEDDYEIYEDEEEEALDIKNLPKPGNIEYEGETGAYQMNIQ